jgi:hypothetical protein
MLRRSYWGAKIATDRGGDLILKDDDGNVADSQVVGQLIKLAHYLFDMQERG